MNRRRIRRTVRQLIRRVAYYETLGSPAWGLAPGALDRARCDLRAWIRSLHERSR